MIQARTEGRELTGAAAEYAQETERRTGRKACVPMAAFETRAAQTTSTAAGIVPEDFRADQFDARMKNPAPGCRIDSPDPCKPYIGGQV